MIRFVYLGDQIADGNADFTFFDTVIEQFMSFSGQQVFESPDDFDAASGGDLRRERCQSLLRAWEEGRKVETNAKAESR